MDFSKQDGNGQEWLPALGMDCHEQLSSEVLYAQPPVCAGTPIHQFWHGFSHARYLPSTTATNDETEMRPDRKRIAVNKNGRESHGE